MAVTTPLTRSAIRHWHFPRVRSGLLAARAKHVLGALNRAAIILSDGKTLAVKPGNPADIATLPHAAALCHQYLHLKDKDVVLVNDPSVGGTDASDLTIIIGVACWGAAGSPADMLLASRLYLPSRVGTIEGEDQEGLRLPPTPVAFNGKLNHELLETIAGHDSAHPSFFDSVTASVQELLNARSILGGFATVSDSEFRKASCRQLFQDSSKLFRSLLHQVPFGSVDVTCELSQGNLLRLQLEVTDSHIHLDFAGSELVKPLELTELSLFGSCLAAITIGIRLPLPLNSGVFDLVQVRTPTKMLSQKVGSNSPLGHEKCMSVIVSLVQSAFTRLLGKTQTAGAASCMGHIQLHFETGQLFTMDLAPGSPATKDTNGMNIYTPFARRPSPDLSIEYFERRFPILCAGAGVRAGSGGKGLKAGGDGEFRVLEMKAPGIMIWQMGPHLERHDGLESGRAGLPGAIEIIRGESKEELTQSAGKISLAAGDQVRLFSSGGGGYGEPKG